MKEDLRKKYKKLRTELNNKSIKDKSICKNFLNSNLYKKSTTILCYYSTKEEIDTKKIIKKALSDNKKVALPKCLDKNGHMKFYYIKSINEVEKGLFNIMEPKTNAEVTNFTNAIILVPGFTFDKNGYRLGYGKGYYDRFLAQNNLISIGLCYEEFINEELSISLYDQKIDFLISENNICSFNKEDNVIKIST